MKKIVTMIPTTLVTNLLLFLNSKTNVKFPAMGTKNIFFFFVYGKFHSTLKVCCSQQSFIKEFL